MKRRAKRRQGARFYREFVDRRDLVFDVGAHRGQRVAMFAALGARVVAFEPQPEFAEILHRQGAAVVECVALGASPGQAEMQIGTETTISTLADDWRARVEASGRFSGERWETAITVRVETLDDAVARHGIPAFCKIDVEGYEAHVLEGLSATLPSLAFEFTPEFPEGTERCLDLLAALAEYEFNVSSGESLRLDSERWLSRDELPDAIEKASMTTAAFGDVYARLA